jgi:hypothetical protein
MGSSLAQLHKRGCSVANSTDQAAKGQARVTADAALGIAWWNAMTERARLEALKAVEPQGRASPAEAWAHWKQTAAAGFKCEENAHG